METKVFRFDLKAATGDGSSGEFTGFAAVYGNKDRNGDIIDPGAMTRTINANDGEFPLLWQHDLSQPIGVVRLEDVARGAKATGKLYLDSDLGRKAYSLMIPPAGFKRAPLRDLSIGYITNKEDMREGARHLKEIHIHEVSLVTVAANPKANVINVKAYADRIELIEIQLKSIQATLAENGIEIDPELFHSLNDPDKLLGGPGNCSDDSGNAHSLSELLTEIDLHKIRREIDERIGNVGIEGSVGRG